MSSATSSTTSADLVTDRGNLKQRRLTVGDEDEKIGKIGNVTFYGPKGWVWIPIAIYGTVFAIIIAAFVQNS
jgi:hypothetical protein